MPDGGRTYSIPLVSAPSCFDSSNAGNNERRYGEPTPGRKMGGEIRRKGCPDAGSLPVLYSYPFLIGGEGRVEQKLRRAIAEVWLRDEEL
jgi:hypothetical protein